MLLVGRDSNYHGHTERGVRRSWNDETMSNCLRTWSSRSDKARNLGSWKRRGEDLKTLGMMQEDEGKDNDQGDEMGRNENTRLICP